MEHSYNGPLNHQQHTSGMANDPILSHRLIGKRAHEVWKFYWNISQSPDMTRDAFMFFSYFIDQNSPDIATKKIWTIAQDLSQLIVNHYRYIIHNIW